MFISSNLFGATINVVDKAKVESFDFSTFYESTINDPFDGKSDFLYKNKLTNITDVTDKNPDNIGVYIDTDINNKNFSISFDNSYLSGDISNINDITIKNSLTTSSFGTVYNFVNGNNFIIENSYIGKKIKGFQNLNAKNSYINEISDTENVELTNSAVSSLIRINGKTTLTNSKVDTIQGSDVVAYGGRIGDVEDSTINLNGTEDKKIIIDRIFKSNGSVNNADIRGINASILKISNSKVSANMMGDHISQITLIDSIVDKYAGGSVINSKGSEFNDDINAKDLFLGVSDSGKQSKVKSYITISSDNYDIDKLDTGNKYDIKGKIIGTGTIKNSTINMQVSGGGFDQNYFYNDTKSFLEAGNIGQITLDNVIATNSVRAHTLNINNSKIAKRVLANNLTSNNTAYYLGANKESYIGAIISRENTSGANNELVLLNVMSDNKLDTSKINANLPLAILKKGTGTAELATFFKDYKISDGISDYVINNDYIASTMLGDYLTYAITTTKNGKVSDTGLNADNIASIANGDKTSTLGKLVNQSAGDYDGDAGLKAALDNLAKQTVTINPENPSNPDTGVTTPDSKPDTGNPDTGVTIPEEKPEEKPDTDVTNPNNKPDNKPDTGVTNPDNQNKIADDFIKDIKINKKAKAQAQVISNGIKLINTFAWNNMNKRLGEIRGLDKELGIWARAYYTNASIDDVKLNSTEVQFGADKANDFADGKVIAGIMANVSNSKSSDVLKSDNYGFGLYASYISNDDLYADLVIKANHYKVKYNSELLKDLKDSKTGFIASIELGKRFDLNRFYVEPSIEAIFDYTPKTNLENNAISITSKANSNLHLKPAIFSGFKVNDNANLRLGAGYIIDVNKPSDTKIIAKSSKASEIIEGKRDNKFYLNLTGDYKFNDNLRLNLGYERTFGADLNIDNQINAVIRYTF